VLLITKYPAVLAIMAGTTIVAQDFG